MKNSLIFKFSISFLAVFGFTVSNAQVLTNNGQSPLISNSNVLIDGSSNYSTEAGAGPYVGKGIIIPSVDLVNFVFDLTLADGSTFPTYFDGMVVYNSATGTTLTTGNRSSIATSVTPGFYYFSNPNGASNSNVTGGVWKPLGGASISGSAPIAVTSGVVSLSDLGVTNSKIADSAVTTEKIADGSITNVKIFDDSVTNSKIGDFSVTASKIANSSITSAKLQDNIVLPGTAGMTLPSGTTAQRPVTAAAGLSRYNTTDSIMEYYNGTTWVRPTPGTIYTGSVSTVLNGNSFERAALTGDVTAAANSNATTIANDAVTSAKILDGTITSSDLSASAGITNGQLANNSVTINGTSVALGGSATITASPTNSTLPSSNIWVGSSTNEATAVAMIGDATMSNTGIVTLANNAVETPNIVDNAIISSKIFDGSVTNSKIEFHAVTNSKIADNAIDNSKILNNTITADDISSNAGITNGQLANNSVTINGTSVALGGSATITASPTNSTLPSSNIWVGSGANQASAVAMSGDVTMSNTGAVTIEFNAVTNSKIADNAIDNLKILNNTITADDISSNAGITNGQLANSSVTINGTSVALGGSATITASPTNSTLPSSNIWVGSGANQASVVAMSGDATMSNTGAVTIANNAITNSKLADNSVDTSKISDYSILNEKIAIGAVTSGSILNGAITSDDINASAGITNGQLANSSVIINGTSVALGGSATITASPTNSTLPSTNIWVGSGANQATAVAMSGDATMSNTGIVTLTNNAVETPNIVDNAIITSKIFDGSVTNSKIALSTITNSRMSDNAISSSKIIDGAVTSAKLENNIVLPGTVSMTLPSGTTAQRPVTAVAGMSRYNTTDSIMEYYNGSEWVRPTPGTIYTGSVSTVLNGNSFERAALTGDVTAAANSNATTIANNAVTSAKILDGTITSSDLSASAGITNGQLANNSVTINGTIVALGGSATITASPTTSTLPSTNIWVGSGANQASVVAMSGDATMSNIGAVTIANNAITTSKLADISVTNSKLVDNSVSTTKIFDNAITTAKIADGSVTTTKIANNSITSAKLDNNIVLPGTASMTLPSGTTAQRPVTAVAGMSRYNTTDSIMEYYNGTTWVRPTPGTIESIALVTSNITLNETHSVVRINTASSNITVTLPSPSLAVNRIYSIIKGDSSNNRIIFTLPIFDYSNTTFTDVNIPGEYRIQSNGLNWYLVN